MQKYFLPTEINTLTENKTNKRLLLSVTVHAMTEVFLWKKFPD